MAVLNNDTKLVKSILNDNQENLGFVNARMEDANGVLRTSLDFACDHGYVEIVKDLISIGEASPDIRDSNGYTALYKAVENGHLDVVKILVEEGGADVDLANGPDGFTVLMETVQRPSYVQHIFLYLVNKVKYIDSKNFKQFTTLCYAAEKEDQYKTRILLDAGADPNMRCGADGLTAVMTASQNGALKIVKLLMEEGEADPEIGSRHLGKRPIHLASFNGHAEIVNYLITQANVNAHTKDLEGFTPLYLAAHTGSDNVIKILVEIAKVDINSKNGKGFDSIPLAIASRNGYPSTVRYLLAHGARTDIDYLNLEEISSLYVAAHEGHTNVVKILIEIGRANVEVANTEKGWTALHVAAHRGYLDIVKYLIEQAGANGHSTTGNNLDTPLTLAGKNGHGSVAQYLRNELLQSSPMLQDYEDYEDYVDDINFESRPGDRVFFQ